MSIVGGGILTRARTKAAVNAAIQQAWAAYEWPELPTIKRITTPVAQVTPMSVLTGPRADYEAAMVAKYGDDWENM